MKHSDPISVEAADVVPMPGVCEDCGGDKIYAKGRCRRDYDRYRRLFKKPCGEEGCPNLEVCRGLCNTHYRMARIAESPLCDYADCDRSGIHLGHCESHRKMILRGESLRSLKLERTVVGKICRLDYCDEPVKALKLCMGHYKQDMNGTPFRPLRAYYRDQKSRPMCDEEACDRLVVSKGKCKRHYDRNLRHLRQKQKMMHKVASLSVKKGLHSSLRRRAFGCVAPV